MSPDGKHTRLASRLFSRTVCLSTGQYRAPLPTRRIALKGMAGERSLRRLSQLLRELRKPHKGEQAFDMFTAQDGHCEIVRRRERFSLLPNFAVLPVDLYQTYRCPCRSGTSPRNQGLVAMVSHDLLLLTRT